MDTLPRLRSRSPILPLSAFKLPDQRLLDVELRAPRLNLLEAIYGSIARK